MTQLHSSVIESDPVAELHHVDLTVANALRGRRLFETLLDTRATVTAEDEAHMVAEIESAAVKLVVRGRGLLECRDTSIHAETATFIDRVGAIGFVVADVNAICSRARAVGIAVRAEPQVRRICGTTAVSAALASPGEIVHWLVEDRPADANDAADEAHRMNGKRIVVIDHVAIAVVSGTLELWERYYSSVFGLIPARREVTETATSGMRSTVMTNRRGTVQLPLVEGLKGRRRSQVDEFVQRNGGPGVQHLAFLCSDILAAAKGLGGTSLAPLRVPDEYYRDLATRLPAVAGQIDAYREMNVLADIEDGGLLLQMFTTPISNDGTVFLELVQRMGAKGFGSKNIKALFAAVEQARSTG